MSNSDVPCTAASLHHKEFGLADVYGRSTELLADLDEDADFVAFLTAMVEDEHAAEVHACAASDLRTPEASPRSPLQTDTGAAPHSERCARASDPTFVGAGTAPSTCYQAASMTVTTSLQPRPLQNQILSSSLESLPSLLDPFHVSGNWEGLPQVAQETHSSFMHDAHACGPVKLECMAKPYGQRNLLPLGNGQGVTCAVKPRSTSKQGAASGVAHAMGQEGGVGMGPRPGVGQNEEIAGGAGPTEGHARGVVFNDRRKESKQERAARMKREKNRRNQQAFRERCRAQVTALRQSIAETQKKIDESKRRRSLLLRDRPSLTQRCQNLHVTADMPDSFTGEVQCSKDMRSPCGNVKSGESQTEHNMASKAAAAGESRNNMHAESSRRHHAEAPYFTCGEDFARSPQVPASPLRNLRASSVPCSGSQHYTARTTVDDMHGQDEECHASGVHDQAVRKGRGVHSSIWSPTETDPMHETPSTAPKALISYSNILQHAPRHVLSTIQEGSSDNSWIEGAIAACMNAVASLMHLVPNEILWVTQLPYEVEAGRYMSTTGDTTSFQSALAIVTNQSAIVAESLLLNAEHQYLEEESYGATESSFPWKRTGSKSVLEELRGDTVCASTAPPVEHMCGAQACDEELLRELRVQCGVDQSTSVTVSVKNVVPVMLRKENSALPYSLWRAACMRVARWLQASIDSMSSRTPHAEDELRQHLSTALAKRSDGMHEEGLPLSAMPAAHLLVTQAMLRQVMIVLHAPPAQALARQVAGLPDVRSRILEVVGPFEILRQCIYTRSPRDALHTIARVSHHSGLENVKTQRLGVKVIKSLNMTTLQTSEAARQWHGWRASRAALDAQLATVRAHLNQVLPWKQDPERVSPVTHFQLDAICAGDSVSYGAAPVPPEATTFTTNDGTQCQAIDAQASKPAHRQQCSKVAGARDLSRKATPSSSDGGTAASASDDQSEDTRTHNYVHDMLKTPAVSVLLSYPFDGALMDGDIKQGAKATARYFRSGVNSDVAEEHSQPPHNIDRTHPLNEHAPEEALSADALTLGCMSPHPRTSDHAYGVIQVSLGQSKKRRCGHAAEKRIGAPSAKHRQKAVSGGASVPLPNAACTKDVNTLCSGHALCDECKCKCGQKRPRRLLGECGEDIDEAEHALSKLLDWSHNDLRLIKQATPWIYRLTPVQHARGASAYMHGAPKFDYLQMKQMAAEEQRWKELFATARL